MRNILVMVMTSLLVSLSVSANDGKLRVAIFDPIINTTNMDDNLKSSIREIITSSVVNSDKYNTVERSLLEKVFQEQSFSNSGVVNDNDAVEIGKLTGANKVVVSLISPAGSKGLLNGGKQMVSIKIIDVKTANIDKQKVKMIKTNNLLNEISTITNEMVNGESNTIPDPPKNDLKNDKPNNISEFVLHLSPGYIPDNVSHKDNYIEVLLNGDVVGGGTISEGFDIKIAEKKHKKYKIEIRPTCTSENGKTDMKAGKTQYNIDTFKKQRFDFMIQSQQKGKWTIYTVRLK